MNHVEWECCSDLTQDQKFILEDVLPENRKYKVQEFNIIKESDSDELDTKFTATVLVNVCEPSEVYKFLDEFFSQTSTTFNKDKADRLNTDAKVQKCKVLLGGSRKCIHAVRKQSSRAHGDVCHDKVPNQNTECPGKLTFALNRRVGHTHERHTDDGHCNLFNLKIQLNHTHNHVLACLEGLKFHPVSKDTKNEFISLFEEGYTASGAYSKYRENLLAKLGPDEYTVRCASRALLPSYDWCFYEHRKFKSSRYGRMNSAESFRLSKEKIEKYCQDHGLELAKFTQREDKNYIAVLLDPMSLRVHETLPQAGDVVMLDATSGVDRIDSKVFRLVTPSPAGSLPLGTIVCSSESESVLTEAFTMYKSILPSTAFFGRGSRGPRVFLTDDAETEFKSFQKVFPESTHLLCQFHLLQGAVH